MEDFQGEVRHTFGWTRTFAICQTYLLGECKLPPGGGAKYAFSAAVNLVSPGNSRNPPPGLPTGGEGVGNCEGCGS